MRRPIKKVTFCVRQPTAAETTTNETRGNTMATTNKTIVKTISVKTPHGAVDVPHITSYDVNGRTYYTSHVYNSMAQRIWGGSDFPASDVKLCQHYGVPVVPAA